MKIKVGELIQPLTGGTSRNIIYSFTDYQNSKPDMNYMAYIVDDHRISVFPFSFDFNRIRDYK